MPNRNLDSFEKTVGRIVQGEVEPVPYSGHIPLGVVLGLVERSLSTETEQATAAHLALCPTCRRRLQTITQGLEAQAHSLERVAEVGTLPRFIAARQFRRPRVWVSAALQQVGAWLNSLYRPLPAAVLVTSAALVAAICILAPPAFREWSRANTAETRPTDVSSLQVKETPVPEYVSQPLSAATPQALVATIDSLSGYPYWRAAATILGLLRSAGVPLDHPSVAFEHARAYVVRPGDTWESIAQEELGESALWPLVVLLNRDATVSGEPPALGRVLRLPE